MTGAGAERSFSKKLLDWFSDVRSLHAAVAPLPAPGPSRTDSTRPPVALGPPVLDGTHVIYFRFA